MPLSERSNALQGLLSALVAGSVILSCPVFSSTAFASQSEVEAVGSVRIDQSIMQRSDSGSLVEFVPVEALLPSVIDGGEVATVDVSLGQTTLPLWSNVSNAVDHIVYVNNKGFSSSAYFRTIVAVESLADSEDDPLVLLNCNKDDYLWGEPIRNVEIEVDGKTATYDLYVAVYGSALDVRETATPSLLQFAIDPMADSNDFSRLGETFDILVKTEAVEIYSPEGSESDPRNVAEYLNDLLYPVTASEHPWSSEGDIASGQYLGEISSEASM